jgi:hypothetical protein
VIVCVLKVTSGCVGCVIINIYIHVQREEFVDLLFVYVHT